MEINSNWFSRYLLQTILFQIFQYPILIFPGSLRIHPFKVIINSRNPASLKGGASVWLETHLHLDTRLMVDGRNPANQLRLVVHPIIYRVSYIQTVVGLGISEPSTVPPSSSPQTKKNMENSPNRLCCGSSSSVFSEFPTRIFRHAKRVVFCQQE